MAYNGVFQMLACGGPSRSGVDRHRGGGTAHHSVLDLLWANQWPYRACAAAGVRRCVQSALQDAK